MTKNCLLVGSGNIGRRHLQAMMRISGKEEINFVVVEPDEGARAQTTAVIEAAKNDKYRSARVGRVVMNRDLEGIQSGFDLAVIATNSGPRRKIFDALEESNNVKAYILEKILFTTTVDLNAVGKSLSLSGKSAFVNCARRLFPAYHSLQKRLSGRPNVSMHVSGSQYGLASNGIHFIDLLTYLTGDKLVSVSSERLQDGCQEARRAGYVEVFGTLDCTYRNGGKLTITCHNSGNEPVEIALIDGETTYKVHEGKQTMEIYKRRQTTMEEFAIPYISDVATAYEQILQGQDCGLTNYELSASQHQLFIDAVRGHLDISIEDDASCPIS